MREERTGRAIANGLIFLPIFFAVAYLLLGYSGARWMFFYGLWCILAALVTARLMGRLPVIVQILGCAVASAAALLLPAPSLAQYVALPIGLLLTLFVERTALKENANGLGNRLLVPLGSVLVAAGFIWIYTHTTGFKPEGSYLLLFVTAALWLIVALLLTHRSAYRDAAIATTQQEITAGVRRSGFAGLAVLLAVVFALVFSGPIGRALGVLFGGLGHGIAVLLTKLAQLFMGNEQAPTEPEPTGDLDMNQFMPAPEGGPNIIMQIITYVLMGAVLLAMVALLIYGLTRLVPKIWRDLSGWAQRVFGGWREDTVAYSDRNESLLSLRQALDDAGASVRRFARRFRPKPKLEDCPTNAEKVRFLFREYLRNLLQAGRTVRPGDTPATIVGQTGRGLWEPYNRTRYRGDEPTDEEVQRALAVTRGKQ